MQARNLKSPVYSDTQEISIMDKPEQPAPEWVSTSQAAEILGVSRTTIHAMIDRGDIRPERIPFGKNFIYRIRRKDLDSVILRPHGRPPKTGG